MVLFRFVSHDTWTHGVPDDPGAYSQDALSIGNAAAQREQFVAEHKILQKSYNDYLGVEEAGKEPILYAVGDDALAPLKKLYIGFRVCCLPQHPSTSEPEDGNPLGAQEGSRPAPVISQRFGSD